MLVLSRHPQERLCLILEDGREIWITVVEIIRSHQVRLGLEGPKTIKIFREEIRPQQPIVTSDK